MITTIKKINVGSAFRVGAIVSGLLYTVIGLLLSVMPFLFLSMFSNSFVYTNDPQLNELIGFAGTAGALSLICAYLVGIVFAAIIGGIGFALTAWFYNLASRWVGGIEIELQNPSGFLDEIERDISSAQKAKRDTL